VLVAVVLVGTLGVVHGIYSDRWGPSGQLQQSLTALDGGVPTTFGDWVSEENESDPEMMARAGIKGWVSRRYTNVRTRETVSFLVVCGRGGPLSVHTPDVCYAGAGFAQLTDAKQKDVVEAQEGGRTHTFRVARFGKPGGVAQSQLEIYWGWSRDGRVWTAPDSPRMALARFPALYKMYIVREFIPSSKTAAADPCQEFLRRALPELRTKLTHVEG